MSGQVFRLTYLGSGEEQKVSKQGWGLDPRSQSSSHWLIFPWVLEILIFQLKTSSRQKECLLTQRNKFKWENIYKGHILGKASNYSLDHSKSTRWYFLRLWYNEGQAQRFPTLFPSDTQDWWPPLTEHTPSTPLSAPGFMWETSSFNGLSQAGVKQETALFSSSHCLQICHEIFLLYALTILDRAHKFLVIPTSKNKPHFGNLDSFSGPVQSQSKYKSPAI